MKKHIPAVFLILVFIFGLSLLLYPALSSLFNSVRQSRTIEDYSEKVNQIESSGYDKILEAAENYNAELFKQENQFELSDSMRKEYNELLDIGGTGVMGYIEIPSIEVSLPIYHGTSESVLQIAAGHLEWSSLPVGGAGTHCVISSHRGLPGARLFTDLDKMVEGDIFMIRVLDMTLTYEVDQILTVKPYEVSALVPEEGEDLCTLVTCTPYGINSHRLLIRGHRLETEEKDMPEHTELKIDPLIAASIIAAPILIILLIIIIIPRKKK